MKEFLEFIVKYLVAYPEDVVVTEVKGEKTTVYELYVGKEDFGKVIGRRGQTAWAIRTLLSAVSGKQGRLAILEILN